MFLDDQLLQICKSKPTYTREDIQDLYVELSNTCLTYFKSRIDPLMNLQEIKATMERTFNLWNSFTEAAIKEGGELEVLGNLFQKSLSRKCFWKMKELKKFITESS